MNNSLEAADKVADLVCHPGLPNERAINRAVWQALYLYWEERGGPEPELKELFSRMKLVAPGLNRQGVAPSERPFALAGLPEPQENSDA